MTAQITQTVNRIEQLLIEGLPGSHYQFELFDIATNTRHFRGIEERVHWGSIYKLFVVAEIIKMADEGLIKLSDELELHKELYKNGNGSFKHLTYLNKISFIDACKMTIATSDNLLADELLNKVGFNRFNDLFKKAGCENSKLTVNLDDLVKTLFKELSSETPSTFFHSPEFFEYFDSRFKILLEDNYTTARDINTCFHFLLNGYLTEQRTLELRDCLTLPNVHSRVTFYNAFGKIMMRSKTGRLGLGMLSNEAVLITHKETKEVLGHFTICTTRNKKRYFESSDVLGLIGLEISAMYEQLHK